MLIIDNNESIIDIINRITDLERKFCNDVFLKQKNEIELLIKANNAVLLNYSKLKLLKESTSKTKIIINVLGNIENPDILQNLEELHIKHNILRKKHYLFSTIKLHLHNLIKLIHEKKKYIIIFTIIAGCIITYYWVAKYFYYEQISENTKSILKEYSFAVGNNAGLKLYPLIVFTEKQQTFLPNHMDFSGTNRAIGNVTFRNYALSPITLIQKTRLKDEYGKIFRTIDTIGVPKAIKDSNGEILPGMRNTTVIADILDENGEFIGQKGNITNNTSLNLVQKTNFDITIQALGDFYGGKDNYNLYFNKADIKNIENIFRQEIQNKALFEANEILKERGTNLVMLTHPEAHVFQEYESNIGKTQEQNINIKGSIKATVYYIDTNKIVEKMSSNRAYSKKNMRIKNIEILEKNPLKVKISFELPYE